MSVPLLVVLAACTFLMAMMELVVIGFLDMLAVELGVSTGQAGLMLTVHAGAVALTAPFAAFTLRYFGAKGALSFGLAIFAAGNMIIISSSYFEIAILGRVLTGIAHGVFFPVAFGVATSATDEAKQGAALGLVMAGVAVATVLGAPIGTYIGREHDWTLLFLFAGIVATVLAVIVQFVVPLRVANLSTGSPLPALRNHAILFDNVILALAYVGLFTAFGFVGEIAATGAETDAGRLAFIFLVFGVSAMIGNTLGGTLSDRGPERVVRAGLMLLTIGLLSLWVLSETEWGIYAAVAGMGAGFSTFSPALNLLLTRHDPKLATQALGLGISATNIGIAIGASVGGASLSVLEAPQLGAVGAMTVLIVLTWRFIRNPTKQMEVSS